MNRKRIAGFAVVAVVVALLLHAQRSFWDSPNAYLGQTRPSDTPLVFAPGHLADSGMFPMGRIAFSSDGKEIYFSLGDSWNSGENIKMKVIRYAEGRWGKPVTINEHFLTPTFSMDGNTLYMRKVVKGGSMKNVWRSERSGSGWSAPAPFLEESYGVYDFMPTASGNAYVGSDPGPDDVKNGSTYVYSLLTISDGKVTVKSLGRPLNARGFNGDLFIAPDESYMIASTNETKDYESELYISFRKPDATWTRPVSLGPKINNGLAHRWGQYVTPDSKYLFYTHGTSEKDCAIYWVRFDTLLGRLRSRELARM
jgi:hypothetical protein